MDFKLKAIIIDDEFRAIEVIDRYVSKVDFLQVVRTFNNPIDALSFISNESVDLVFLDINMPELTGLDFAKLLDRKTQIVFTTAYSEFAIDGFDLEATDYLIKPIEFDRFLKACLKVKGKLENVQLNSDLDESDRISLRIAGKTYFLRGDDFMYAEKLGNDIFIHLINGRSIKARVSIKDLMDRLPPNFIQVHKSFIVSIEKVDVFEKNQVVIGDKIIPIGRTFKNDVTRHFQYRFH